MAKDFLGKQVKEGDTVIFLQSYGTSSVLLKGEITKLSDKTAVISTGYGNSRRKSYDKIVKISDTMLLLKVKHRYDEEYETVGLFSSEDAVEEAKAEYLKPKRAVGLDVSGYQFTCEAFPVDKPI